MSDLNNANLPTTASLRVDYADTMRANFNRAITLNPGSMTNLPAVRCGSILQAALSAFCSNGQAQPGVTLNCAAWAGLALAY